MTCVHLSVRAVRRLPWDVWFSRLRFLPEPTADEKTRRSRLTVDSLCVVSLVVASEVFAGTISPIRQTAEHRMLRQVRNPAEKISHGASPPQDVWTLMESLNPCVV